MKKLRFIAISIMAAISMQAQLSKSEVETIIKTVNFQEIKDVYLIRTRQHDGTTQGWFERFEEFDPKTIKISYNENSLLLEGSAYTVLIPYDKIKVIFYKKQNYLTFEMLN
jgi:hypothetical protein